MDFQNKTEDDKSKLNLDGWSFIAILPYSKADLAQWKMQCSFRKGICLTVFLLENVIERELSKQ
jgi:hypothetical protein